MHRSRKALIVLAALGLVASACLWAGIKIGRPIYYSDGNAAWSGVALRDAGMLRWDPPQQEFAVPGPVRGRVTELPDGRVIYGLARSVAVTDLVVFDPRYPTDPVQPVIELNSPGHDLAPALGPGGRLYFASDRPSGSGGFDIYTASYRDGVFFAPRALPEGINTGLDESDPTVDRAGGQIVFVRRDPELQDGSNGTLVTASLAAPDAAVAVFSNEGETVYRRGVAPPVDRDPAFAPDGIGLYFVRRTVDGVVSLMRTAWHLDHYVDPMPVRALQEGGPFRGPTILDEGLGMRLVGGGTVPAEGNAGGLPRVPVFRAKACEVYPSWEGQWWLEWLLGYAFLFFALLLVLLTLGARWSSLDFVTRLLLLSILIHLLLLLWLSGVEIIRRFEPRGPEPGTVQVHLVSRKASDSGQSAPAQNRTNLAESVQFEGHEQAFATSDPATEVATGERALAAAATAARPALAPQRRDARATLADPAAEIALRAGQATESILEQQPSTTAATTADRTADRTAAAMRAAPDAQIRAAAPQADTAADLTATSAGLRAGAAPAPRRVLPAPRLAASRAAVADAAAEPQRRANTAAAGGAAAALRAVPAPPQPVATATPQPAAQRRIGAERAVPLAAPRHGIAAATGAPERRAVPAPAPAPATPRPRRVDPRPRAVADAPEVRAHRGGAAPPARVLTRAARADAGAPDQSAPPVPATRTADPGAAPLTVVAPGAALPPAASPAAPRVAAAPPRPLPERTGAIRGGAVAVRDVARSAAPAAVAAAAPAGGEAPAPRRLAAADLGPTARVAAAVPAPSRGDPGGAVRPAVPEPGSLLEPAPHRAAVPARETRSLPRAAAGAEQPLPAAVALRDDTGPAAAPAPAARAGAGRPAPASLAELRRVQQRRDPGIARPPRDAHTGGLRAVSIGIAVPGSFVARAGIRQAVPAAAPEPMTLYSNRFGASKMAALERYGGTEETERAVQRGLAYLQRIQNADGSWGNPRASQRKYGQSYIGKSGLCLLAFLGAGHTPESATAYSETTRRAVDALLATQRSSGHFGVSSAYSHGITMYALAECYAMTKAERLRAPLESAVRWVLANQNRGRDQRNRGGWGYFSSTLRPEDPYSRTSTTAWQVMALESAKLSGIDVPDDALALARAFLLSNYDRRYRYFLYNKEPQRLRSEWRTLPASTPAAVFCLQLLGLDASDARLRAGLAYTLDRRPQRYRRYSDDEFVLDGAGNVYFWYYSTLACFLAGGDAWQDWNAALKRVLLAGQAGDGSFPIIDAYARYAGDTDRDRSYTTAMCVLSLEIYYRYFTPLLKQGR